MAQLTSQSTQTSDMKPNFIFTGYMEKNITLQHTLDWVYQTSKETVIRYWAGKVRRLNDAERDEVIFAITSRHNVSRNSLKADLRAALEKGEQQDKKFKGEQAHLNRKAKGIYEVLYCPTRIGAAVKQSLHILMDKEVFLYGEQLVSIKITQPKTVTMVQQKRADQENYPDMRIISRYTKETLRHKLEDYAVCIAHGDEERNPIKWPDTLLNGMLETPSAPIPPLTGIIEHPYITINGELYGAPGFDPNTGLYVNFPPNLHFDLCPSIQAAQESLAWLQKEFLAQFPFDGPQSESAALSALLTALEIKLLRGQVPGFMSVAPAQGTGKTALFDLISRCAYGRPVAAATWSENETDMHKHILSILQEGQSMVLFDNLPLGQGVESAELAKVMTSPTYSGRILGATRVLTVPTHAMWCITGNNIYPVGDFNSRFLPIKLDAKCESPDRRTFSRDLEAWSLEYRCKVIQSALTIIQSFLTLAPDWRPPAYKESRFKGWDRMVRLPLIWAGSADPADLFDKNQSEDPKLSATKDFFHALNEIFQSNWFTAKHVDDHLAQSPKLADAANTLFGFNVSSVNRIAKGLTSLEGRILDGLSLEKVLDRRNGNRFRIINIDP